MRFIVLQVPMLDFVYNVVFFCHKPFSSSVTHCRQYEISNQLFFFKSVNTGIFFFILIGAAVNQMLIALTVDLFLSSFPLVVLM